MENGVDKRLFYLLNFITSIVIGIFHITFNIISNKIFNIFHIICISLILYALCVFFHLQTYYKSIKIQSLFVNHYTEFYNINVIYYEQFYSGCNWKQVKNVLHISN